MFRLFAWTWHLDPHLMENDGDMSVTDKVDHGTLQLYSCHSKEWGGWTNITTTQTNQLPSRVPLSLPLKSRSNDGSNTNWKIFTFLHFHFHLALQAGCSRLPQDATSTSGRGSGWCPFGWREDVWYDMCMSKSGRMPNKTIDDICISSGRIPNKAKQTWSAAACQHSEARNLTLNQAQCTPNQAHFLLYTFLTFWNTPEPVHLEPTTSRNPLGDSQPCFHLVGFSWLASTL